MAPKAADNAPITPTTVARHEQEVVDLRRLSLNSKLQGAARQQALFMQQQDKRTHKGPGGSGIKERLRKAGYQPANCVENAAAGGGELGTPDNVKVTIYASWNGATEVTTWRVLARAGPGELEPVGFVPREGFETAIEVRTDEPYVAVRTEDDSGRALGTSEAVKPGS